MAAAALFGQSFELLPPCVAAPRQYAQKLGSKLLNAGARPLWVPGVSIGPVEDGSAALQEFDSALQQLIQDAQQAASSSSTAKAPTYTHVAFTSKVSWRHPLPVERSVEQFLL
jgi:uroporphyrinogen-III synthase